MQDETFETIDVLNGGRSLNNQGVYSKVTPSIKGLFPGGKVLGSNDDECEINEYEK